ncbi:hypothetical protein BDR04DRAFT_1123150 [Suillus decipiens]|nr:hypothetical protein BDR04DRAFT_1123150 [Suillus decipiens]
MPLVFLMSESLISHLKRDETVTTLAPSSGLPSIPSVFDIGVSDIPLERGRNSNNLGAITGVAFKFKVFPSAKRLYEPPVLVVSPLEDPLGTEKKSVRPVRSGMAILSTREVKNSASVTVYQDNILAQNMQRQKSKSHFFCLRSAWATVIVQSMRIFSPTSHCASLPQANSKMSSNFRRENNARPRVSIHVRLQQLNYIQAHFEQEV